ncbi:transcriptional regulator with XRE-family HTH domain [Bradyrhizobium sp. S3.9.2]|uniref:helix-turn-helix domain-containing protein n=1 Tax=Bradyrhizobium sp. S3.9.2 TaxID=3156432 RepID=UPI00339B7324
MRQQHEPVEPITDVARGIAQRLQAFRIARGLSRAELADLIDTTEAEIIAWETPTEVIYTDEAVTICKALRIDPHELLGWQTKQ